MKIDFLNNSKVSKLTENIIHIDNNVLGKDTKITLYGFESYENKK